MNMIRYILYVMFLGIFLLGTAPKVLAVPSLDNPDYTLPAEVSEVEIFVDGSRPSVKPLPKTAPPTEATEPEPTVDLPDVDKPSMANPPTATPAQTTAPTVSDNLSPTPDNLQPEQSPDAKAGNAVPSTANPTQNINNGTNGNKTNTDFSDIAGSPGIQEVKLTDAEAAMYGVSLDMGTNSIPAVVFDEKQGKYIPETEIINDTPATPPANLAKEPVRFLVKEIKLETEELKIKNEELQNILNERVGQEVTLAELNETVGKVTLYCRQHGYPASAAYLPVQDSTDGAVTVKVIPGRYGEIRLHETGGVNENLMRSFTNGLKHGKVIKADELQTVLYSLSELSGTKAIGVLSAGKEFGTSDVTVRIEKGKTESTVLYAENYGSESTGRYRYGLQYNKYDVGGTGARISAGGIVSNGGLRNYYANYEFVVGHGGTSLGVGVSRMNYQTGTMDLPPTVANLFRTADAEGTADTVSLYGSRTMRHTVNDKFRFTYGFDYRKLTDETTQRFVNYPGLQIKQESDKHSAALHLGVDGFWRKPNSGLMGDYEFKLTTGNLSGTSTTKTYLDGVEVPGAGGTNDTDAAGSFTKAEFKTSLVKSLGHSTDIMFKLSGQYTGTHLDNSEGFYLGGANGVRAYPQGAGLGDTGYLATAELRYHLPVKGLTLSTYFDLGHTNLKTEVSKGYTLKGWGVGLSYNIPGDWFARLDYARRIGWEPNLDASSSAADNGRFWFILGKIW
ncbi:MAG: ShlB/FhaC/HecB family hemolysin secretion/activation protein [Selenomonadaceae bacterium]|nr:ShlB/FhaC/HecB family hemolysin secretion/activation protein [Selenomonadaceae bacterium]